ncbi:hypothetical protein V5799_031922, partial [Amblyomma americanum]
MDQTLHKERNNHETTDHDGVLDNGVNPGDTACPVTKAPVTPPPSVARMRNTQVPKPKPLTRWAEFAKQKGIKPRKREKLVWDETIKDTHADYSLNEADWRPRYGYKRAKVEKEKNWVVEIPTGKDPMVDYHAELKKKKKERVAKNEYQRLRNIAQNHKAKVPKNLFLPTENLSKDEFESNFGDTRKERDSQMKVFEEMQRKKPKLDVNR